MIIIAKMLNIRHVGQLSNALNKAGIFQEIDFKRSYYLGCSMRHTNHSSIFGMTTTGTEQSLYSSRDAVNQGCQGLKGKSLSCINDCLSQFRQISRLVALVSMVRVTSDHMFSIGFISGDTANHSLCSILSFAMKFTTVRAV